MAIYSKLCLHPYDLQAMYQAKSTLDTLPSWKILTGTQRPYSPSTGKSRWTRGPLGYPASHHVKPPSVGRSFPKF